MQRNMFHVTEQWKFYLRPFYARKNLRDSGNPPLKNSRFIPFTAEVDGVVLHSEIFAFFARHFGMRLRLTFAFTFASSCDLSFRMLTFNSMLSYKLQSAFQQLL